MPEDISSSASQPAASPSTSASAAHRISSLATGASTAASTAPSGHAIRRSLTVDETRSRPSQDHSFPPRNVGFRAPPRRTSNFTDYSMGEARDILNPISRSDDDDFSPPESSTLAPISLALALLPALAGALFKNGAALVTDLMLLGLAGVFLHWSVTQPWAWYHAAQEVRIRHEANTESAIDEDSDLEDDTETGPDSNHNDVLEEEADDKEPPLPSGNARRESTMPLSAAQKSALRGLYIYETLALMACFALPLLAAYLLHTIRAQLSRPSEGLVSNYNLTVFCLASELRVFSHMFKLLHSRTLHLRRIVRRNLYSSAATGASAVRLNEILERLETLERRLSDGERESQQHQMSSETKTAAMIRQVRSGMQPELDALIRAVRRYEKKATLLQLQTESRFETVDARLEDAIALAAAAAKNSVSHRNMLAWINDAAVRTLLFPFRAALQVLLLPVKMASALGYRRGNREPQVVRAPRTRGVRVSSQSRYDGDRAPARGEKW